MFSGVWGSFRRVRFHGAGGKDTEIGPSYFGLDDLADDSTVFAARSADGVTMPSFSWMPSEVRPFVRAF